MTVWALLIVLASLQPIAAVLPTEAACLERAETILADLGRRNQAVAEVSCTRHRLPRLGMATGDLL